ncbi:MAG: magnesium transporter [Parachlamydiaceae bacterium]|nr:magnesium transporter [Parachlamydiaceae bacterium]
MSILSPYSSLSHLEINEDNISSAAPILNRAYPVELADFIADQTEEQQRLIFNALTSEKAVLTFEYLPFFIQKLFLETFPLERSAPLLNSLSPDDRTALLEELPPEFVSLVLKHLSPEERALSIRLLGYPKNSVGRLMTPDYMTVKLNWTVQEVLDHIRKEGHDSETLNVVYAVNDEGVLLEDFRIREFLLNPLDAVIKNLADHKFISLNVTDSSESAIRLFRRYGRSALPVLDQKGVLLGIVTVDDIMELSVEEDTEDIQKGGGVAALREPYMAVSLMTLIQKRLGWLSVLFMGELFTASAMGYFEGEISKAVVLSLFLPLIISSGGNAGSQASTLIVRAIALGEVTLRDWWRIMQKEIFSGLILGIFLGTLGFLRVAIWGYAFTEYGEHWLLLALTILFSLMGIVLWGTLTGSMLPLILNRCGFDPATSSTPFVATLVDVTGVLIYFNIALIILRGTLL